MAENNFYRSFEDRYRGSRGEINTRLCVYLPFVLPLSSICPECRTLDLGCGRGEWLELMGKNGFHAHGVDLDEGMLAACHERGFSATRGDAIAYLQSLPDESQVVVSGFHIAEHLLFEVLQTLVQESLRVLKPGGLLILETPNPENLVVGTASFYLDPTHQRPLPPSLLSFLAAHYGFARNKILRLQESSELSTSMDVRLLNVINGVSPDYAVVAQKIAPPKQLSLLDAAFEKDYGLTLETLSARYEVRLDQRFSSIEAKAEQAEVKAQQAETKAEQAETKAEQAETKAEQAETKAERAEVKAQQAEARAERAEVKAQQAEARAERAEVKAQQAEARAEQAEVKAQQAEAKAHLLESKAQQAEARVTELLNSTSWCITAPIRIVVAALRGLGPGSLGTRANIVLRHAIKIVMARPRLRKIVAAALIHFPVVIARLHRFMLTGESDGHFTSSQKLNTGIPKKIAVDLTPILPGGENGGAKVFVIELLRRLCTMKVDTEFLLLTRADSHDELAVLDGPNVIRNIVIGSKAADDFQSRFRRHSVWLIDRLPFRVRAAIRDVVYRLRRIRFSRKTLRGQGVDLLFCPFTAPTYYELGIPTVSTIYDLQYKTFPEFFSVDDIHSRDRSFTEACRYASALTAISEYSRQSAINHGNIDPERIHTIYLRMAQRISSSSNDNADALLRRFGLVQGQFLLYPANFWKHKNHEMLLTAFGIASMEGLPNNVKLVCTGAPSVRRDWLIKASRALGLNERVLFPGYLSSDDLGVLMNNCTAVIFPSLYEGFGLPVIEAMAAGVPVACSRVTSLPEVVGDAAILFDPRKPVEIAQSIVTLVCDVSYQRKLIESGRKRAIEFADSDRMVREYWDLFCFALTSSRQESLLSGAYADGWVGSRFAARVAPALSVQTLELEFSVPDWLPHEEVRVSVKIRGDGVAQSSLRLNRGESATMKLPFAKAGGGADFFISPTFVPVSAGKGEDYRELSIMLRRCSVVGSVGNRIELFPILAT